MPPPNTTPVVAMAFIIAKPVKFWFSEVSTKSALIDGVSTPPRKTLKSPN